jgi:glycosyltransferase involved in cell wall biosynthesis
MHVVFAVHQTKKLTGIQKYYYTLTRELTAKGVKVTLIIDYLDIEIRDMITNICGNRVNMVIVSPYANNQRRAMMYSYNVGRQLQQMQFDIFHTAHVNSYFYNTFQRHNPIVFQPFGNELFTLSGKGLNAAYCKLAQQLLRYCGNNADVLLSEGEFQNTEMHKFYPKAKTVRILPVGIDTNVPHKASYKTGDSFKLLAVNSLLKYEGMDTLIEAFYDAWLYNNKLKLTIVGTGPLESKLKSMASAMPVTFLKDVPEVELQELYAASDAFVSTTRETDFQMSVLEAMAAGLPVLSVGLSRWLPDCAMTYNGSCKDLTSAMLEMSGRSNTSRTEMGKDGIEFVKDYDMKVVAEKAIEIYKELLNV